MLQHISNFASIKDNKVIQPETWHTGGFEKIASLFGNLACGNSVAHLSDDIKNPPINALDALRMHFPSFMEEDLRQSCSIISDTLNAFAQPKGDREAIHNMSSVQCGLILKGDYFHEGLDAILAAYLCKVRLRVYAPSIISLLLEALVSILPKDSEISFHRQNIGVCDAYILEMNEEEGDQRLQYFRRKPCLFRPISRSLLCIGSIMNTEDYAEVAKGIHCFNGRAPESLGMILCDDENQIKILSQAISTDKLAYMRNPWMNNFEYRKSILLLNKESFYDAGWVLFKREEEIHPINASVHYHTELNPQICKDLQLKFGLRLHQTLSSGVFPDNHDKMSVSGEPQFPWYNRAIETIKFLKSIEADK